MAPEPASDLRGVWGSAEPGQPHLAFGPGAVVSGSDGCNRLRGTFTRDGAAVVFGPLGSTRMFCPGVDPWLAAARTAEVRGDILAVFGADGVPIGELLRRAAPAA